MPRVELPFSCLLPTPCLSLSFLGLGLISRGVCRVPGFWAWMVHPWAPPWGQGQDPRSWRFPRSRLVEALAPTDGGWVNGGNPPKRMGWRLGGQVWQLSVFLE